MKEFYQDIVNRLQLVPAGGNMSLSPLEKIICMENISDEDMRQHRRERLSEILQDIARREAIAEKYGDGEKDVFVSIFRSNLGPDKKTIAELKARPLSPTERSWLRRYERYGWGADVYLLLRQGLSPDEIASALGISDEEVHKAERRVISAYDEAARRCNGIAVPRREFTPEDQTYFSLLTGHYRVFRQENTGVTQYRFYHKGRLLGTGSAGITRDFPLVLCCGGLILNSKFDPAQTVVPGRSREIVDADNANAVVARLTYLGDSRYELVMNWDTGPVTVQIQSVRDQYQFICEGRQIARISPLAETQHILDWQVNYCMDSGEELPDETALLLMSFPLLRFTL